MPGPIVIDPTWRDEAGKFKPGHGQSSPGHKLAHKNRRAKAIEEMFLHVLEKLGGEAWLMKQARLDPATFIGCLRTLLPRRNTTMHEVNILFPDLNEAGKAAAQVAKERLAGRLLNAPIQRN